MGRAKIPDQRPDAKRRLASALKIAANQNLSCTQTQELLAMSSRVKYQCFEDLNVSTQHMQHMADTSCSGFSHDKVLINYTRIVMQNFEDLILAHASYGGHKKYK